MEGLVLLGFEVARQGAAAAFEPFDQVVRRAGAALADAEIEEVAQERLVVHQAQVGMIDAVEIRVEGPRPRFHPAQQDLARDEGLDPAVAEDALEHRAAGAGGHRSRRGRRGRRFLDVGGASRAREERARNPVIVLLGIQVDLVRRLVAQRRRDGAAPAADRIGLVDLSLHLPQGVEVGDGEARDQRPGEEVPVLGQRHPEQDDVLGRAAARGQDGPARVVEIRFGAGLEGRLDAVAVLLVGEERPVGRMLEEEFQPGVAVDQRRGHRLALEQRARTEMDVGLRQDGVLLVIAVGGDEGEVDGGRLRRRLAQALLEEEAVEVAGDGSGIADVAQRHPAMGEEAELLEVALGEAALAQQGRLDGLDELRPAVGLDDEIRLGRRIVDAAPQGLRHLPDAEQVRDLPGGGPAVAEPERQTDRLGHPVGVEVQGEPARRRPAEIEVGGFDAAEVIVQQRPVPALPDLVQQQPVPAEEVQVLRAVVEGVEPRVQQEELDEVRDLGVNVRPAAVGRAFEVQVGVLIDVGHAQAGAPAHADVGMRVVADMHHLRCGDAEPVEDDPEQVPGLLRGALVAGDEDVVEVAPQPELRQDLLDPRAREIHVGHRDQRLALGLQPRQQLRGAVHRGEVLQLDVELEPHHVANQRLVGGRRAGEAVENLRPDGFEIGLLPVLMRRGLEEVARVVARQGQPPRPDGPEAAEAGEQVGADRVVNLVHGQEAAPHEGVEDVEGDDRLLDREPADLAQGLHGLVRLRRHHGFLRIARGALPRGRLRACIRRTGGRCPAAGRKGLRRGPDPHGPDPHGQGPAPGRSGSGEARLRSGAAPDRPRGGRPVRSGGRSGNGRGRRPVIEARSPSDDGPEASRPRGQRQIPGCTAHLREQFANELDMKISCPERCARSSNSWSNKDRSLPPGQNELHHTNRHHDPIPASMARTPRTTR
ncbi:MAG: hypothetical protein PGN34_20495 [Methylobacterium frigidaeris]